jgi:serine/threonine-protein kinase RsbW
VTNSARFECELHIVLPATLAAIEEFFVEFRRRAEALLERRNCFAAELLVREALTNAVVHGCGADPAKKVHCRLRLRRGRLLIVVADEGPGFDWRSARERTALEPDTSGRGMEIYYRYAQRVRFNEKGNAVAIIRRVERGKDR